MTCEMGHARPGLFVLYEVRIKFVEKTIKVWMFVYGRGVVDLLDGLIRFRLRSCWYEANSGHLCPWGSFVSPLRRVCFKACFK